MVRSRFRGLLHQAEARLRLYLKKGRRLQEKTADRWAIPYIDAVIADDERAVEEQGRPRISIDFSGLERIRADALETCDSLLTEDELQEETTAATPAASPAAEENASSLPLDQTQLAILRTLLAGGDVGEILRGSRLTPSLLADAVNEIMLDEIGDTVLLCEDDRLCIVEDYAEDVARLLGGTTHD